MQRPLLAVMLAALLLIGCGDPKAQFVGSYTGHAEMPEGFTNLLNSMGVEGGADGKRAEVKLNLAADGKCELTTFFGDEQRVQDGDWTYDGGSNTVTLNVASPYLRQEDIDEMKSKGMTEEMIEKSSKNPMISEPVTKKGELVFKMIVRDYNLSMTFTKSS